MSNASTRTCQPGGTAVVALYSVTIAGPRKWWPARRLARTYTGVSRDLRGKMQRILIPVATQVRLMKRRNKLARRGHGQFVGLSYIAQIQPPLGTHLIRLKSLAFHLCKSGLFQPTKGRLERCSGLGKGRNRETHRLRGIANNIRAQNSERRQSSRELGN